MFFLMKSHVVADLVKFKSRSYKVTLNLDIKILPSPADGRMDGEVDGCRADAGGGG